MLDRLVESKNHKEENKKLNGLFATIFTASAIGLTVAFAYSLFSFELNLGGDLELTSLVAPTLIEEIQPEPQVIQKEQSTEKVTNNEITRVENIQRPEETPVKPPETISVTPSTNQARPNAPFKIGLKDYTPTFSNSTTNNRQTDGLNNSEGISTEASNILDKDEKEQPVIKQKVKQPENKIKPPVSGGVLNGKAINLVMPIYSNAAKQVQARGRVEVQVTIDEKGRVISASVINGHTLLRDSALRAAKATTFSPTTLTNQPVKVTGILIYNFTN